MPSEIQIGDVGTSEARAGETGNLVSGVDLSKGTKPNMSVIMTGIIALIVLYAITRRGK